MAAGQQINAALVQIKPKIVYVQPAWYKNIDEAVKNADAVKPFVDNCIIVTDVENTPRNANITFWRAEWNDDFPTYHNYLIEAAREAKADYILMSDPDEHFDTVFLGTMRYIIMSNPQFNGFEVYGHLNIQGHEKLDAGTFAREAPGGLGVDSNSWKLLLWKLEPMTRYAKTGTADKCVHHTIVGNWNVMKLPKKYFYTHDKTHEDVWASSARNIFICGGGDNVGMNNPYHVKLHEICDRLNIKTYREFVRYCEKGRIDAEMKLLFLEHRNDEGEEYSSEIRDVFHWYFDYLNPEENTGYRCDYTVSNDPKILAEQTVQKLYFEVLGRHTDEEGKDNYVNILLQKALDENGVRNSLLHSEERLRNLVNTCFLDILGRGASDIEVKVWSSLVNDGIITDFDKLTSGIANFMKVVIAYCQMTYKNDLDKTIQNVKDMKPYVDVCIVVHDDTLTEEDIKKLTDAGARARYHKWHDNFPMQRNKYLQEARAYGATWVMVSDPDEHFDIILRQNAKILAQQADMVGANLLLVNAHDIYPDNEQFEPVENPQEMVPDYYKNLFFKLTPEVMYLGVGKTQNLHEDLIGNFRTVKLPREYFYRHYKSHREICEHSARNIFIGGGGMNKGTDVPAYGDLKKILNRLSLTEWYQFRDYLAKGNIDNELAEFIKAHRSDYGADYTSEYRELFSYYYVLLHPEENVDNLKIEINKQQESERIFADDIERFVNETYKAVLKRDADTSGLENYTAVIKAGMIKKEDLQGILQSSDEYKNLPK